MRVGKPPGVMPPTESASNERAPDTIDLASARDLRGRANEIWVRRLLVLLVVAIPVIALFNVFGQRSHDSQRASPAAALSVHVPSAVRGGLLFEARFTIVARQSIQDTVLELSPEWADGLTINTLEPAPTSETSDNGWLSFDLGELPAGQTFQLHLQYQVNPTSSGGRDLGVRLMDGQAQLTSLTRHLQVWP